MRQRTRKLIGTVLLLVLVIVWALFGMLVAQGRVVELPSYTADLRVPVSRAGLGAARGLADPLDGAAGFPNLYATSTRRKQLLNANGTPERSTSA